MQITKQKVTKRLKDPNQPDTRIMKACACVCMFLQMCDLYCSLFYAWVDVNVFARED